MKKQAHIVYSGIVQGVGFRWTAERAANSVGLTGWVQNTPKGTVEVLCEGEEQDIRAFLNNIEKAMQNYVRSSDVTWQQPTGEFDSFEIRLYR